MCCRLLAASAAVFSCVSVLVVGSGSSRPVATGSHVARGAQQQAPVAPPQPCAMPAIPPVSREQNVFSDEQATMLGEIVMQQISREFKIVHEPGLTEYLQQMTDRLAAIAGAGAAHVQIIDLPQVNAMTLPGRQMLVARKLVAVARSEDELAGVIAHELGHMVKRDPERDLSAVLRAVLNVTSVGNRKDIEEKYNQLLENERRNGASRRRSESDREQKVADQVAIWVMARAGYSPQAYADVFNRVTELQSKTGNWLTDLFGTTSPEAKRLRAALQASSALLAACEGTRSAGGDRFADWQQNLIDASRGSRAAALHGVTSEHKLDPPLRSDLAHLKFSPDGTWVLAQDDASLYLYARTPLAFQFRVDARDAFPAQFTPDSTAVVFYDENYRVERWNLASKQREWVHEVVVSTSGCMQTELSPDGGLLVCVTPDFTLRLQQVVDAAVVFERKDFYALATVQDYLAFLTVLETGRNASFFQPRFSPDCRYFVAARGPRSVAYDLSAKTTVSLPGAVRDRIGASFAFVGNDRIAGVHIDNPQESAIVTFPQGQVVRPLKLGWQQVTAATRGDRYLILRGVAGTQVAVFDCEQNKVILGTALPGLDLYDDNLLSERKDGELGLYRVGGREAVSVASVPTGPLGRLRAAEVSPDFGVVAISETSRGGLWELNQGQRKMLVRGFRGVHVDAGQMAYADFPRLGPSQRAIAQLDAGSHNVVPLVGIQSPPPANSKAAATPPKGDLAVRSTVVAANATQHGAYVLGWIPSGERSPRTMVAYDATSGREAWRRPFAKGEPAAVRADGRHHALLLGWMYASDGARAVEDANPSLKTQFDGLHARKEDVSLNEIVDLATGKTRGYLLIDSGNGSFRLASFSAVGDVVIFGDNRNRTLAYSLPAGRETGHVFGTPLDVADNGVIVAVQNNVGKWRCARSRRWNRSTRSCFHPKSPSRDSATMGAGCSY